MFKPMPVAMRISGIFGHDGRCMRLASGESIEEMCRTMPGAQVEQGEDYGRGGMVRYLFDDGTAIVIVAGRAWDTVGPECECGWCWESAGAHCYDGRG